MSRTRIPSTLLPVLAALVGLTACKAGAERAGAFPHLEAWPSTLALGGITAALGEGVEAVLDNPTGTLMGTGSGVAFSHASLFTGGLVSHQAAAVCWVRREERPEWKEGRVVPIPGRIRSAYGLGVTNLSGELPGSDSYGEIEIALTYAQMAPFGVLSGFRLRMLQARSTVDGAAGSGLALDWGIEGSRGPWRMGAAARAFASTVNWDRSLDEPIPRGFDLGLEREVGRGIRLLGGGTLLSSGEPSRLALATSWQLSGTPLTLRAGPAWRDLGGEQDVEISAGIGVRAGALEADYGMRTGPPGLGEIHRFALRLNRR